MPRPTLTIEERLAKDRVLLQDLNYRIDHFDEVEKKSLYDNYWPEFADREAPHRLRNLKNRRYNVLKRIAQYESNLL